MSVPDDANTGSFNLETLQQKRLSEQKGSNLVCKLNLTQLMKRHKVEAELCLPLYSTINVPNIHWWETCWGEDSSGQGDE
jgi:hypothetical protein